MTVEEPQDYSKRLLPQILDSLALAEPERIIYSVASFENDTAQFQTISARAFAKAVDKTAWWLHDQLKGQTADQGGSPDDDNNEAKKRILPVGYIGPRELDRLLCQRTLCLRH